MFQILLILFALSIVEAAPQPVDFSPQSTAYKLRLKMLTEMAQEVGHSEFCPEGDWGTGLKESFSEVDQLGLLGGIFLNTAWQKETGRNQSAVWALSNSSLTVDTYGYYQAWRAKLSCNEAPFIRRHGLQRAHWKGVSFSRLEVCESWHSYFDHGSGRFKELQTLLWRAHSLSLLHVWAYNKGWYEEQLATARITPEDYRLWNAWNQVVVDLLPKFNVISCGQLMFPLREVAMPYCQSKKGVWTCQPREPFKDPLLELYALGVESMIEERKSKDLSRAIDLAIIHLKGGN